MSTVCAEVFGLYSPYQPALKPMTTTHTPSESYECDARDENEPETNK